MATNTVIPTPPRLDLPAQSTGDHGADIQKLLDAVTALNKHVSDFHNATVAQAKLLDPSFQGTPAEFSLASLPDPAASSIATATAVAVAAYKKAFGP